MNLSSCRQSQNRRTGARNQPEIGLKLVLRRLFSRCARCRKFITRSRLKAVTRAKVASRLRDGFTPYLHSAWNALELERAAGAAAAILKTRLRPPAVAELLVGEATHHLPRFHVTNAQIGRLQARPTGLTLSKWQAFGLTHDLAHACMAKQMGMHRCRRAGGTVFGRAEREHADRSAFGCLFDDDPGLPSLEWPAQAVNVVFAREKEWLVVGDPLF